MKAVILAGGRGSRLGSLTHEVPKPLIKVCGKPLIMYTLDALPSIIDECVIVVGYLGLQIERHLGTQYAGRKLSYVEQECSGTGGALLSVRQQIISEDLFLVIHSDDIFGQHELGKFLIGSPAYGITYGIPNSKSGFAVVFDQECRVTGIRIDIKACQPRHFGVGAYVLNPLVFDVKFASLPNGELSLPHSIASMPFRVYVRMIDMWLPINTVAELASAERAILEKAI